MVSKPERAVKKTPNALPFLCHVSAQHVCAYAVCVSTLVCCVCVCVCVCVWGRVGVRVPADLSGVLNLVIPMGKICLQGQEDM